MAIVDQMFCPLHKQGTIFMWYVKLHNGDMIYEYDDRSERTKWDKLRLSYLPWLDSATQRWYRRDISTWDNIKRFFLSVFDNLLCSVNPDLLLKLKENKFYELNQNDVAELGIMGNGGRIYFNTEDGIIHLDGGRDLNIFFNLGDTRVDITNSLGTSYNKLIERHYTSYEFDLSSKGKEVTSDGNVNALAIGYNVVVEGLYNESEFMKKKAYFDCELIYVLPFRQPNYVMLSITSETIDTDVELHLTFLANDDKQMVHLEKGKKETFTIAF